jgi:hypothetical protein
MLTGTPFIPETITVHLGFPDSEAPDVTVGFASYVKNVTRPLSSGQRKKQKYSMK